MHIENLSRVKTKSHLPKTFKTENYIQVMLTLQYFSKTRNKVTKFQLYLASSKNISNLHIQVILGRKANPYLSFQESKIIIS